MHYTLGLATTPENAFWTFGRSEACLLRYLFCVSFKILKVNFTLTPRSMHHCFHKSMNQSVKMFPSLSIFQFNATSLWLHFEYDWLCSHTPHRFCWRLPADILADHCMQAAIGSTTTRSSKWTKRKQANRSAMIDGVEGCPVILITTNEVCYILQLTAY